MIHNGDDFTFLRVDHYTSCHDGNVSDSVSVDPHDISLAVWNGVINSDIFTCYSTICSLINKSAGLFAFLVGQFGDSSTVGDSGEATLTEFDSINGDFLGLSGLVSRLIIQWS